MVIANSLGPKAGSISMKIIITATLGSMISADADAAALAGSIVAGTGTVQLVLGNAYGRVGLECTQHSVVQI